MAQDFCEKSGIGMLINPGIVFTYTRQRWSSTTFHPNDFGPLRDLLSVMCMILGLPDPHPYPLVRGTDPRIRIRIQIRTKMSRIPNTGFQIRGHDHRNFLSLRILGFRAVCQHGSNIPGYWPEENNQLGLLAYHTR
jgi:hypothetical protein